MARIAGVDLPQAKRVEIALTYIYGIGLTTAQNLCASTSISPSTRVQDLTEGELDQLRVEVSKLSVEGDLRRETQLNIKRLLDLGCNRGIRHRRNLPVRGQRTKTNARTRKGPKRPVRK